MINWDVKERRYSCHNPTLAWNDDKSHEKLQSQELTGPRIERRIS
jgi:hypothetical protein